LERNYETRSNIEHLYYLGGPDASNLLSFVSPRRENKPMKSIKNCSNLYGKKLLIKIIILLIVRNLII